MLDSIGLFCYDARPSRKVLNMTKRDFELIARVIDKLPIPNTLGAPMVYFIDVINGFANELEKTNPGFNRESFMRACMKNEN